MTRTQADIGGDEIVNYIDARDLVLSDLADVTSWVDQINSIDWAEATNPPHYVANQRAGHPAVKFDGVNEFLKASSATLNLTSGCVITACIAARDTATSAATLVSVFNSTSDYFRIREQQTQFFVQDVGGLVFASTVVSNSLDPVSFAFRYQSARCQGLTLNDASGNHFQTGDTELTDTGSVIASNDWYLGKRGDASTQPWDGALHAFAIFKHTVDWRVVWESMTQMNKDFSITDPESEPVPPAGGGGSKPKLTGLL